MALRLIELVLTDASLASVQELLSEFHVISVWQDTSDDGRALLKILIPSERTEAVLDVLEERYSTKEGFRIVILPVEASIPRLEPEVETIPEQNNQVSEQNSKSKPSRISREELYSDVQDVAGLSNVHMIMVALSSVVAAVGMLRGNVAIIIGAMVIAPLLGPNVALSLATTLADMSLGRKALKTSAVGIMLALTISFVLGFAIPFDPLIPEIASRTEVSLGDVALALASGTAGALAFTTGIPSALIGVMVAVALLPPLVAFGLLMGSGNGLTAIGSLLLFLTNIICVNLAGVATFLVQGIRPLTWWEAARARRAARFAMILWFSLLLVLVVIIGYFQQT
jgi:uncharacterized hydrophobic protein (TIGR00341 family)